MIQSVHVLLKKADERSCPTTPLAKTGQVPSREGPVVVDNNWSLVILVGKVDSPGQGDIWDVVPNVRSCHLIVYTRNNGVNPVLDQGQETGKGSPQCRVGLQRRPSPRQSNWRNKGCSHLAPRPT